MEKVFFRKPLTCHFWRSFADRDHARDTFPASFDTISCRFAHQTDLKPSLDHFPRGVLVLAAGGDEAEVGVAADGVAVRGAAPLWGQGTHLALLC